MRRVIPAATIALLVVLAGCSGGADIEAGGDAASGGGDGAIGVAAGGAQDANAFRENVEEGHVPQPTDLTYEGLFHDYYFDTDQERACEETFCPSYSKAVTRDPVSNETERFVTVGLNSGISQADFERDDLNLVVVIDTSGSMSSEFAEYYYDGGERQEVEENQRKMDAAEDAVVSMLGHLDGPDRVGVVEYDSDASVVHELRRVDETDRGDLRESVRGLEADGGTNLDAGMETAREMVADHADEEDRETRIVYVTDAQPNLGNTDGESLSDRLSSDANDGIHTTFVGVGIDFNSRLTEEISTVKGANYYAVQSPSAFEERMDEGFSYMVTPLVYNLSLSVQADGYEIEKVYGSPQADRASGELMEVRTLFPSRKTENGTEGGVVLLELARTGDDPTLNLTASYEETDGTVRESNRTVAFEDHDPPYYESTGVRKAVALSEYGNLMRNWMAHERAGGEEIDSPEAEAAVEHREYDDQWEQTSVDLTVSEPYDDRIDRVETYFRAEMEALGDESMERDLAVLETLAGDEPVENGTAADGADENATAENGTDAAAAIAG